MCLRKCIVIYYCINLKVLCVFINSWKRGSDQYIYIFFSMFWGHCVADPPLAPAVTPVPLSIKCMDLSSDKHVP